MTEQRVQYKDHGLVGCGIVREQKDGKTLVYWGATDKQEFTSWVDDKELEAFPEKVYFGDLDKKTCVYDPAANPWTPTSSPKSRSKTRRASTK